MAAAPVVHLETVDSTMDELAALLIQGAVESWTAVLAEFQRKGRGRAGRSWQAPPGSALLTTIYAPIVIDPARVGMLAIAAGLAVVEALARLGVNARLKWPNDVLANDKKLAGILISTRLGAKVEVSVGIGLNLTSAAPNAIAFADLCPHPPSALAMLESIRDTMIARWSDLERGRFRDISHQWNGLAAWAGDMVSVTGDEDCTGRLLGVDEWGRLRLDTEQGVRCLAQSEIVRGPVPCVAAPYTCR